MRQLPRFLAAGVTILVLTSASAAYAQDGVADAAQKKIYTPIFPETTRYPVDVDRVREKAEQLPAIKLDDQQLRFYATVIAREQTFFDKFAKDFDFRNGPTRGGAAMTYNEFVKMTRPKELDELLGSTSMSTFAMLQAAMMNAAGQAVIKKGLQAIHDARNEREIQQIRQQINRELAALLGK